jgi:carboxymethylenebutenolidase
MTRETLSIPTADGTCPASLWKPAGTGPWPAVIVFMDGLGIRPAIWEIGERLASTGYLVLMPDLYYRSGPYEPMIAAEIFGNADKRAELGKKFMGAIDQAAIVRDARAFLDLLAARGDVVQPKVGVVGYCMGGGFALAVAGSYPDRIAAAAAYHPANLATDLPTSPHLLAPKIRAQVYVGGASEDAHFPDEQKQRLAAALDAAGVVNTVETYPCKHGWVPSDTPVHDPAGAEKHWQTLGALLANALR